MHCQIRMHETEQQLFSVEDAAGPSSAGASSARRPCWLTLPSSYRWFNYAQFVISGPPCLCTSSTPEGLDSVAVFVWFFSIGWTGLTPSVAQLLVAQISLFRRLATHGSTHARIWISSANDNTSTVPAGGWIRPMVISPVRPRLIPAFIMEPFNNNNRGTGEHSVQINHCYEEIAHINV